MKVGVLFTGGKDSCYAMFLAKKMGNELACLITLDSENKESYMFHTPSINCVKKQAEVMGIPLTMTMTEGVKEEELQDLAKALAKAKEQYKIQGIVTGAVASEYQSLRIRKICKHLKLECLNPLWHKDEIELLNELLENKFEVILTGVFAYPLNKEWLGRRIDSKFIEEAKKLQQDFEIHPAGEGGEFESLVLSCPLFKKELKVISKSVSGGKNSWRMDVKVG